MSCDRCEKGLVVGRDGKCTGCLERTFFDSGTCKKCGANCLQCKNGKTCDKCDSSSNLNKKGKCIVCKNRQFFDPIKSECKCEKGTFLDKKTRTCKNCGKNCLQCSNAKTCKKCDSASNLDRKGHCHACIGGQKFDPFRQVCTCKTGSFFDLKSKLCETCPKFCK